MLSERCPNLVILSTSREPLDIDGEVVWRVGPLLTLDPDQTVGIAELKASDAVQLFTERAASVRPGFELPRTPAISQDRLHRADAAGDRAGRSRPGRAVVERRAQRARRPVLAVGPGRRTAPTRHQTLRAAIEWSLDLLEPSERLLFDRLSVFAGSGTNAAAGEVCAGGAVEGSEVSEIMGRLVGIAGLDRLGIARSLVHARVDSRIRCAGAGRVGWNGRILPPPPDLGCRARRGGRGSNRPKRAGGRLGRAGRQRDNIRRDREGAGLGPRHGNRVADMHRHDPLLDVERRLERGIRADSATCWL